MLGICFGVFIHVTVGSSFHTRITSEPPKELRVHFSSFSRVWGWMCVERLVREVGGIKQGNRKLRSQNDKRLFCRLEETFFSHWLERTCCTSLFAQYHLFHRMWLDFLKPPPHLPLSSYLQWNFQMAFVVQVESQIHQGLNL